jgi:hypothetical protein
MISLSLEEEAEECRRKALCYLGRPEAPLLLKVAREFDRLALQRLNDQRTPRSQNPILTDRSARGIDCE